MATATPEQIAQWPEPNYINPETRVGIVFGSCLSTVALMVVLILVRFYARAKMKSVFGLDDWIMGAAAIFVIAISLLGIITCKFGLGYHIWDMRSAWLVTFNKMGFASETLFSTCVGLTKVSICITYFRIFPSQSTRLFCYSAIAFLLCYTVSCTFIMLFQCTPIRGYWDASVKVKCINMRATLVSTAALNSLSDFLVYLWPARYLWDVQLPKEQRIALISAFTVGCTVCVAGICRMYYLEVYFGSYDVACKRNSATLYAIITVEMNIGIICGSLPGLKPIISALFTWIFGPSENPTAPVTPALNTYNQSLTFGSLCKGRGPTKRTDDPVLSAETVELGPVDWKYSLLVEPSSKISIEDLEDGNVMDLAVAVKCIARTDLAMSVKSKKGDDESDDWIMYPQPAHVV